LGAVAAAREHGIGLGRGWLFFRTEEEWHYRGRRSPSEVVRIYERMKERVPIDVLAL